MSDLEFTERELKLIENCKQYALGSPAGLPGHNLMIIIHKLSVLLAKLVKEKELDSQQPNKTSSSLGDRENILDIDRK